MRTGMEFGPIVLQKFTFWLSWAVCDKGIFLSPLTYILYLLRVLFGSHQILGFIGA